MEQEESHRWGKSTHCDLPTVSERQLGMEPGTWRPPEDGSAPLQNLSPVLRSESGAWILIPALLVPLWTSIRMHSKDNSFEGFF